jgi:hypothetical protein
MSMRLVRYDRPRRRSRSTLSTMLHSRKGMPTKQTGPAGETVPTSGQTTTIRRRDFRLKGKQVGAAASSTTPTSRTRTGLSSRMHSAHRTYLRTKSSSLP